MGPRSVTGCGTIVRMNRPGFPETVLFESPTVKEPAPAVAVLAERYGIGFTDIVKRPTAGSGEFRHSPFNICARGSQFVAPTRSSRTCASPGDANHHLRFIHSITPHSSGPWQRRPGIAPSLRLAFVTGAGAAEAASRSLGAPAALVKDIAPITTSIVRSGPRRDGFVDGTPRRWTGHFGRRQVPPACSR